MYHEKSKLFSIVLIFISIVAFGYITIKAIAIVQKRQISTSDGIYSNRVSQDKVIEAKAHELTKGCESKLCKVEKILDYVTHIPYKTTRFQAHSPQRTITIQEGDCDDKSNLLISLLRVVDVKSYFVLVPKHIFVIVSFDGKELPHKKALWINSHPYYILESTAKGSFVGYPLHYKFEEIEMILDPFENEELKVKRIEL